MHCHSSQKPVFKIGKTEVYGGSIYDELPDVDMIIELHEPRANNCIFIPIEDFGVPDLPTEFWQQLYEKIQSYDRVMVRCLGGHGRTGMVLAILAGLGGVEYPCRFIRKNYCKYAIETEKQKEYVKRITGCKGDCKKCIRIQY